MEIQDAKLAKRELEEKITNLLMEFEKETGLRVLDITPKVERRMDGDYIFDSNIRVFL